ncbi:MAG: LysR family transcriptional regulator [Azospirillaceae bacterium]|nr:LysR family transcriptional regulator [Azospirillaceae bacterium]
MDISKIDLNLFRVFDAVMRHRSVSAASHDLRVTPSAVSHALARLRQALDDELFVSGEQGMAPTTRALQLAPRIRNGLDAFTAALGAPAFNPSQAIRTFRVAATDHASVVLLPPLVTGLAMAGPQIDLRVLPAGRIDVIRQLDEGRIDFVLGWFKDIPERLRRRTVFGDRETLIMRAGHPLTAGPVTLERLAGFPHLVIELTGSEGQGVDGFHDERGALRRVWIERLLLEMSDRGDGLMGRVAVSVPHFLVAPPLLLASDMIATFPRRLARYVIAQNPLVMLEPPGQILSGTVDIVWHQRADQDAGSDWFVQQVIAAGARIDQP